jgi:two-component system NarL family sensor kinase
MGTTDKDLVQIIIAGTAIVLFLGGCIVLFAVLYQKRKKRFRDETVQLQRQFREELLRSQLEIQEQTLNHISQEIHDNFGQTLSLAKLNLNTVDPQKPEAALEKVASAKALVSKVIQDLRQLSKTLHSDAVLTAGIASAIRQELDAIERADVFRTRLTITGAPQTADPQKELILFRIVQEALHNCLKHSNADLLRVSLNYNDDRLEVAIADNGRGFAPTGTSDGSGLRNMRSRAAIIGGRLGLTTGSAGTTITITLPL